MEIGSVNEILVHNVPVSSGKFRASNLSGSLHDFSYVADLELEEAFGTSNK